MCIALYYINPKGKFRFILLFNREEYSQRPTDQLKVIMNNGDDIIIAGQDQLQLGTWLGFNITNGMVAFLTNKNHLLYVSFQQKISQIINQLRFQYPNIMKYFYPKFKSRGQLIVDLLKKQTLEQPQKFDYKLKDQHLICNYHQDNKNQQDNYFTKTRLIQASLSKQQYMGFNLFVGNIINQEYYILSSTSNQFKQIDKNGTACSFSSIGGNQVEKETIAQKKFEQIIETEENIDSLFEKLFSLAQERFKSSEVFFKAFPQESSFFIPEYKTRLGQARGIICLIQVYYLILYIIQEKIIKLGDTLTIINNQFFSSQNINYGNQIYIQYNSIFSILKSILIYNSVLQELLQLQYLMVLRQK